MGRRTLTFRIALLAATALAGATGCKARPSQVGPDAGPAARAQSQTAGEPNPLARELAVCPVPDRDDLDAVLDMAAAQFDAASYATALACAERAARIAPQSVEAHHDRAASLAALGRWNEARQAFTRALALDPDDPQTLAGAADLYVNQLPPDREHVEIGLEYARRGSAHVGRRRDDQDLAARLALHEAQALDDLGRTDEALGRAEAAVALRPKDPEALYLRGLILFHLCKLARAREALEDVLALRPDDAYAHHHLGLILEIEGKPAESSEHLARARALAPDKFPAEVSVPADEFKKLVAQAIAGLDDAARRLLVHATVEVEDLPSMDDLTAVDPPFPPTILGLFRGEPLPPMTQAAPLPVRSRAPARSIVLYRKNLARAVGTKDELIQQIRTTLWHELGHLRGEDEDDLRARGLE